MNTSTGLIGGFCLHDNMPLPVVLSSKSNSFFISSSGAALGRSILLPRMRRGVVSNCGVVEIIFSPCTKCAIRY